MGKTTEFIQTNDRIVSLKNVSNINVLQTNRIVFNMNYNIEIEKGNSYKFISDYVYWDLLSKDQLEFALNKIKNNKYFKENFINNGNTYININEISSIKFSDKKLRIIINLSHPVSFIDYYGNENITSEFVYWNYNTLKEYNEAKSLLHILLDIKEN